MDVQLRYLERDGVTKDGEKGRVYSAGEDEPDGRAFIARGREDRHQFRFILAPEDSVEMGDLRGFQLRRALDVGEQSGDGLALAVSCEQSIGLLCRDANVRRG